MDDKLDGVRRAIELSKETKVPVTLLEREATMLLERHDQLAIHLLKMMGIALDNWSYAPSSKVAGDQYDLIVSARDYLIEQGLVTREMLP